MNLLIVEYKNLEQQIKILENRRKELSEQFKAKGSFYTREYVVTIQTRSQTRLVGLEKVSLALGRELLDKHRLVQTISFQTVSIGARHAEQSIDLTLLASEVEESKDQHNKQQA